MHRWHTKPMARSLFGPYREKNSYHSYKESEGQRYQEEQKQGTIYNSEPFRSLIYYSLFAIVRM